MKVSCWVLVVGLCWFCVPRLVGAASVWLSNTTISAVYPLSDGRFVLTFTSDAPACSSASTSKYFYVAVGENGVTEEGLDHMLAVALAAASQGNKVSIAFDDASSACYINRIWASFD